MTSALGLEMQVDTLHLVYITRPVVWQCTYCHGPILVARVLAKWQWEGLKHLPLTLMTCESLWLQPVSEDQITSSKQVVSQCVRGCLNSKTFIPSKTLTRIAMLTAFNTSHYVQTKGSACDRGSHRWKVKINSTTVIALLFCAHMLLPLLFLFQHCFAVNIS